MNEFEYLLKFIVVGDTGMRGSTQGWARVAW